MRLSGLKNKLNRYLNKTIINSKENNGIIVIYNYIDIRSETEALNTLDLFEVSFFNFLKIQPTLIKSFTFGKTDFSNFNAGLTRLRREVEILEKIIERIAMPDEPYSFDIELNNNITSTTDYDKFNEMFSDLCKSIETISIKDKAICSLKFQGFERGSNHLQFLVEALNGIDLDMLYAYLNKALDVAKEFILLSGAFAGNKLLQAKARSLNADAKLKGLQADLLKISSEDKNNFIAKEIETSDLLLKSKIAEKATENLINKIIELLEKGNVITPSLNAPKYIDKKDDSTFFINEEELKRIIEEKNKPKKLEGNKQDPKSQS